jgi:uncharacterized protein (TIGR02453 family)
MNAQIIFQFLKDIAANNDREWFNAHHDEYEAAKLEFENFLAQVIARVSAFDDSVRHLQPRDCTYRIYRDLRFSPDKSPYKRHMGGYLNPKGKKSAHSGYYIHFEPDNSMLCSGSICVTGEMTKALRRAVYDNMDEYRSIVEDPAFTRYFPTIGFEHTKKAPLGYPKDYPYIDYLKCKDYDCCMPVPDTFFDAPDLLDRLDDIFRQMKRLNDFVNITIDEMEQPQP